MKVGVGTEVHLPSICGKLLYYTRRGITLIDIHGRLFIAESIAHTQELSIVYLELVVEVLDKLQCPNAFFLIPKRLGARLIVESASLLIDQTMPQPLPGPIVIQGNANVCNLTVGVGLG